jgi:uncharacterized membrane protein
VQKRLAPIDVLRGLVMVLMAVDHASAEVNAGRVFTDSARFWTPGSALPEAQFLTRWLTHLCAPTFVLLAGTALAISVEARKQRGDSAGAIDRHIAVRGALILLFEVAWMSFAMLDPGKVLFQVLYAIGGSLLCMTLLRRLDDAPLLVVALAVTFGSELAVDALTARGVESTLPAALTFTGGRFFDGRLYVAYPLLPWLGIMALGWVLGRRLVAWGNAAEARAPRVLVAWGAAALLGFLVLRAVDGYGNMGLHRDGGALVQWLHVSKYPPSATFACLELGIAALLLAGLFVVVEQRPRFAAPLAVLGQTALFFYLLHLHLLRGAAELFDLRERLGLGATYAAAAAVVVLLYPLCVRYLRYKREHPTSLARFV